MLSRLSNKIKNYLTILSEARGAVSKFSVLLFFPKAIYKYFRPGYGGELPFEVTLENENGVLLAGKNFIPVLTASSLHEREVKGYLKLKEGVFIDVGANIGKYTMYLARKLGKVGKVISIEPEPSNFSVLKKNISLNKLDNVKAFNYACFSKNTSLDFFVEKEGGGLHSIYKKDHHLKKMTVKAKTLDQIVREAKVTRVDLIKIDTEGAELQVILGAKQILKKFKPAIVLESTEEENFNKIRKILLKAKYKIEPIEGLDYYYYAH